MKFRTDFVTNSSSSSFTVEVEIETEYSRVVFESRRYGEDPDFKCTGQDIAGLGNIDELCELLRKRIKGSARREINEIIENINDNIEDFSDISTVTMRKIWAAYGESSGCTIANDWTLQDLSKKIVNAEGEEREELCKALEERLATAKVYTEGGWRDKWPTGFCSPDIIPRYRWDYMGTSAGELAEKIANREITIDDLAVETITVDLQADTPQITESADFLVDGSYMAIGLKKTKLSRRYYRKIIEECCPGMEVKADVDIREVLPECTTECSPIDFAVYSGDELVLAILFKSPEISRSKPFKALKKACKLNDINHTILDEDKDNYAHKIKPKVNLGIHNRKFTKYVVNEDYDSLETEDAPRIGKGHVVDVKFANRTYWYYCLVDVCIGDLVYVDGAQEGCLGMVISISTNDLICEEPSDHIKYVVKKVVNVQ